MKRSIIALFLGLLLMLLIPATAISAEITNKFEKTLALNVRAVFISPTYATDNTVYAISDNQLYRSQDGGNTWKKKALIIDYVTYTDRTQYIYSVLCEGNGVVFLSGCSAEEIDDDNYKYYYFLIKSTDGGDYWTSLASKPFYNLLSAGGSLFGINANYLKKSIDNGVSWNWSLTSSILVRNYDFASTDGQSLWTIYKKKLWHTQSDNSWKEARDVKSNNSRIFAYGGNGEKVLVICNPDKPMEVSISTNNGSTWQNIDFSSVPKAKSSIYYADIASDGFVILSTSGTYILISNDYGKTWKVISEGLTSNATHIKCALQGDSLVVFAATAAGLFRLQYPLKEEISNIPTTVGPVGKPPIKFILGEEKYSLDNKEYVMDTAPFASDGRTFVPLKYLAEALGAEINWDQTKQSISIVKDQTKVVVSINQNVILINGIQKSMDVTPIISNGRTFLPAKYIAEAFGFSSSWDASHNSIILQ